MSDLMFPTAVRKIATSAAALIAELKRGFDGQSASIDPVTLEEIGGNNPLNLANVRERESNLAAYRARG